MAQRLEVVCAADTPPVWAALRNAASHTAAGEPALAGLMNSAILAHEGLAGALSYQIARKLGDEEVGALGLREVCETAYAADGELVEAACQDLRAVFERDPACRSYLQPFLYFKGFQALQAQRIAHRLWGQGRETLAFHIQSRVSELFQVDIHPAVQVGRGVFIDHGTGIVIGETASVGDDVSILQNVTLGGTGAHRGDRHPKIARGVLLGAGAKVLGPIEIGEFAKIASGSVVLKPVAAHTTVAGVPARIVKGATCPEPARSMDQTLSDMAYDYFI